MRFRTSKSERKGVTFRPQVLRLEDRLVPGEVLGTAMSWAMGPLAGAVLAAQESPQAPPADSNSSSLAAAAPSDGGTFDDAASLTICQTDDTLSDPPPSSPGTPAAGSSDAVPASTQTSDQVFAQMSPDGTLDTTYDTPPGGGIPSGRMNFGSLWSPADLSPAAAASSGGAAAVAPFVGNTGGMLLAAASGSADGTSAVNLTAVDSAAGSASTVAATSVATVQAAPTAPTKASVFSAAAVQPASTTSPSAASATSSDGTGDSGPTATPLAKGRAVASPNQQQAHPNDANGAAPFYPSQIQQAYGLNLLSNQGSGQTIYIIDAYNDPNIANDLKTFDAQFGLPNPTLTVHKMSSRIRNNSSWGFEESLDVEWAHSIAPQAKITLVEATSTSFSALFAASDWATNNGAHIVSMSFGATDFSGESSYDSHFNHSGVTYLASTGDVGGVVQYPSASPYVLAVGGTSLTLNTDNSYNSESAWSSGGGGTSTNESRPSYQTSYGITTSGRSTPDVSLIADPNTGVYVYDSYVAGGGGWYEAGGTSLSAPSWAGLIALADQSRSTPLSTNSLTSRIEYTAATGSAYASNYHDVTTGSNGNPAGPGYDQATGVGTAIANNLVPWLVSH